MTPVMSDGCLLVPGNTCRRVAQADQYACNVDYFLHVKPAMMRAKRG